MYCERTCHITRRSHMIKIMSQIFVEQLIMRADKQRILDKDTYLFHQGDPVSSVFVVEEGFVELTRYQQDGTSIVLQRATSQTILAEASVYSSTYHCDGIAKLPTRVVALSKDVFLKQLVKDEAFSRLWSEHLAREVQSARLRSEILSRKTVSERLDGWLTWYENKLPPKGQWKSVAVQIGVTHEALYRELATRRSE